MTCTFFRTVLTVGVLFSPSAAFLWHNTRLFDRRRRHCLVLGIFLLFCFAVSLLYCLIARLISDFVRVWLLSRFVVLRRAASVKVLAPVRLRAGQLTRSFPLSQSALFGAYLLATLLLAAR